MGVYRKRPVTVMAMQFLPDDTDAMFALEDWLILGGASYIFGVDGVRVVDLEVRTLEDGYDGRAKHVASPGDWVIRGVQGEFYPCKPDIFEQTYEAA